MFETITSLSQRLADNLFPARLIPAEAPVRLDEKELAALPSTERELIQKVHTLVRNPATQWEKGNAFISVAGTASDYSTREGDLTYMVVDSVGFHHHDFRILVSRSNQTIGISFAESNAERLYKEVEARVGLGTLAAKHPELDTTVSPDQSALSKFNQLRRTRAFEVLGELLTAEREDSDVRRVMGQFRALSSKGSEVRSMINFSWQPRMELCLYESGFKIVEDGRVKDLTVQGLEKLLGPATWGFDWKGKISRIEPEKLAA